MSKKKKVAIYILVVLVFQELVLRYCFPIPEIQNFDRVHYNNLSAGETNRVHLRNATWYWQSLPDTNAKFYHYMNLYGFRDKEWEIEKNLDHKRFLFIGDSFVEGVMASQENTIPVGFESQVESPVEILNAGILGAGLNEYLQLAADIIPIYKPDYLFFCIYSNDLGQKEVLIPESYLEPIYYNIYKPRLVEFFNQRSTYGPLYFSALKKPRPFFSACPDESNPWTSRRESLIKYVTPKIEKNMVEGTFNPFRVNSFEKEEKFLKMNPKLGNTLPYLKYLCDLHNVKPIVAYIPSKNQVTKYYYKFEKEISQTINFDSIDLTLERYQIHQKVLYNQCAELNIPFVDFTSIIREKEINKQHLYWDYDEHMRGKGYLFLGKELYKSWNTFY